VLTTHIRAVRRLWTTFRAISVSADGEIQSPFLHFKAGTDTQDIDIWFEEELNVSTAFLKGATNIHPITGRPLD
jgi:hypothetical protein